MLIKTLLFSILIGALTCGIPQMPVADDSGLESCKTYCAINFDPIRKPSLYSQCVEECKRKHPKREIWDRNKRDKIN
ncbi:MAG: hypothetical protein WBG50_06235 [Desulfomonilaceae bacterium]